MRLRSVVLGWMRGLEPPASRTTIWRSNRAELHPPYKASNRLIGVYRAREWLRLARAAKGSEPRTGLSSPRAPPGTPGTHGTPDQTLPQAEMRGSREAYLGPFAQDFNLALHGPQGQAQAFVGLVSLTEL